MSVTEKVCTSVVHLRSPLKTSPGKVDCVESVMQSVRPVLQKDPVTGMKTIKIDSWSMSEIIIKNTA
jgi:hypothetical protein